MKRIIIASLVLFAFFALAFAQETENTDNKSETIEITEWEDTPDKSSPSETITYTDDNDDNGSLFDFDFGSLSETILGLGAIIMVFGFPLFVVFIALYFQYKNRKAKYKLVEQALASGQPIPENFMKESINSNMQSKGIRNIFTGIGLCIFLWAIAESFALGTIGLLVMFTGFGQLVVYNIDKNKEDK